MFLLTVSRSREYKLAASLLLRICGARYKILDER